MTLAPGTSGPLTIGTSTWSTTVTFTIDAVGRDATTPSVSTSITTTPVASVSTSTTPPASPSASSLVSQSTSIYSTPSALISSAASTSNSSLIVGPTKIPQPSKKSGVSSGGAAGIAIGCTIAAALPQHEKRPDVSLQSVDDARSISRTVENNLPQPLEDKAIAGEISKISTLIKNHTQSYYHGARVRAGAVDLDALQALGSSLPMSVGTLDTLLSNPTTRETGLRFCIAWVIVSRIQVNSAPTTTFLPPEVAYCMQSMTALDSKPEVRTAFLSKWRTLTAELMHYNRSGFAANDPRKDNIIKAVELLDAILHPYADERIDNNQRRRNLEEILKRAAAFAFILFSQPSTWKFDWQGDHNVEVGSLVIFPALVQLSDETGNVLQPPRAFSEIVVRQV
ncbi:hypothetical protein K432DRAFT_354759 [Lepidopterella palustris CBS 459.81]|uniref:Uncharacterized protein n=1 Tax=Lepidopterella palustris CBS 459.81 TaxID=1314670 RepID=A0A8E2E8T6_9PEZI|nr:hypothetical protein K432DRAFT_354759 [Lepidopterella palustris CBS 459.81]